MSCQDSHLLRRHHPGRQQLRRLWNHLSGRSAVRCGRVRLSCCHTQCVRRRQLGVLYQLHDRSFQLRSVRQRMSFGSTLYLRQVRRQLCRNPDGLSHQQPHLLRRHHQRRAQLWRLRQGLPAGTAVFLERLRVPCVYPGRLRNRQHGVLYQPADRSLQLRRVRRGLSFGSALYFRQVRRQLCQRSDRLSGQESFLLRRHHPGRAELRRVRHGLPCRTAVHQWNLRLPRGDAQRLRHGRGGVLYQLRQRSFQLRRLWNHLPRGQGVRIGSVLGQLRRRADGLSRQLTHLLRQHHPGRPQLRRLRHRVRGRSAVRVEQVRLSLVYPQRVRQRQLGLLYQLPERSFQLWKVWNRLSLGSGVLVGRVLGELRGWTDGVSHQLAHLLR